jgi:hypothetical protein
MDNLGTAPTKSFASRVLYDKDLMTVKKKLQSVTGCAAAPSESEVPFWEKYYLQVQDKRRTET